METSVSLNTNFISVPRSKKPRRMVVSQPASIPLRNKYESLSSSEEEDEVSEIRNESKNETTKLNSTKKAALPPVIIPGRAENKRELQNFLKMTAKCGYHVNYTYTNTCVYFNDEKDCEAFKKILREKNTGFYSFTKKTQKTHAFVVRGLDADPTPQDLLEELGQCNIEVISIYKMRNTTRPLFLIITSASHSLAELTSKVRYLDHCKVSWERHLNKKGMVQCHRCQLWGHATSNCEMPPKCVKCGDAHWTRECLKSKDMPAKCANCGGAHAASNTNCEAYVRRMAARQRQAEQQKAKQGLATTTKYIPAPLPSTNVWQSRMAALQAPEVNGLQARPGLLPTPRTAYTATVDVENNGNNFNCFNDLFNISNKLNSVINLKNMLKAMNDLYNLLSKCSTPTEKCTTFLEFMNNVHSYNI